MRTNLSDQDPVTLWGLYTQLCQVKQAFKNLKGDLAIRPIFHQKESRVEAHIFVALLAYCLHVTLARRLRNSAPGLTPRAIIEKFKTIQMLDVLLPTTDGRQVVFTRHTELERDVQILLRKLRLSIPPQPPPRIEPLKHGRQAH